MSFLYKEYNILKTKGGMEKNSEKTAITDFFRLMSVNHTAIPEKDSDNNIKFAVSIQ